MNCFEGKISIRGLCDEDEAMFYLDDIGIGLYMASKISDEKYISGKNLIKKKIEQAWNDTLNDIDIKGFKFNKTLSDVEVGLNSENTLDVVGFKGQSYTKDKLCNLTKFYINTISINLDSGGASTVKIIENGIEEVLFDGILLDGINLITVNRKFDNFQILYDTTNVVPYSGSNYINDSSDCGCGGRRFFNVVGVDSTSQSYGLIVELQVRCDLEKYLCKFIDKIASAVRYKAGALIWKEVFDSNRFNDLVNLKREDAITQMAWMDSNFNLLKFDPATETNYQPKGMYQQELKKVNIPLPKCNCCMECSGDKYLISLP